MGLSIVDTIINEHNGKVDVESEIGRGAKFQVTLPLALNGEAEHRNKQIHKQQKPKQTREELSGRVLIADDEEGIRELLRESVEDLGLEVDEAKDGLEALEMVQSKKYDYIITDMKMPKLSGDQFIEQAKKLPNGDTRYFVITGGVTSDFSKEKRSAFNKIIDGYILKPFTDKTISEALSRSSEEKEKKLPNRQ